MKSKEVRNRRVSEPESELLLHSPIGKAPGFAHECCPDRRHRRKKGASVYPRRRRQGRPSGDLVEVIAHRQDSVVDHVHHALTAKVQERNAHRPRQVPCLDVIRVHVVLRQQGRKPILQALRRQPVDRVDARYAKHGHLQRPTSSTGVSQTAFRVDPAPRTVGDRIDGADLIGPPTLPIAIDAGGTQVHQPPG